MRSIVKKQGRLITNMTSYAALQIVNMLVGLFLPRLYLAVYGSEVNGIISTANSFISYFSYLEAGIGLTLIHSLFKPLAESNAEQTNGILSYSKKQYRRISGIYFALVVALSLLFPIISSSDALSRWEFVSLVFVIGAYGALDFFTMAKYRVLLTADRKEYVISNAFIIAQLLRFCFVWLLLQFNISVVLVKIVPILTLLVRSLILRIYIKRNYPNVYYDAPPTRNLSVTNNRWDALLLQISINTSISLPTIIISQVLGFKEANVYAVYSMIASAMISIVSALSSGVSPQMGHKLSRGESVTESYEIYDFIVSLIISIVFSTMAFMTIPFVKLYTSVVDDVNYIYPVYAILISVWAALYSYRIPVTAVINAAGIYRENRISNIVNLVLQIVACIVGAIFGGIGGVLVVMILASIQRNIWFAFVNSKCLLHNGVKSAIVYQCLIVLLIVANGWLAKKITSGFEFTILLWGVIAIAVFMAEVLICSTAFVAVDHRSAKLVLRWLKLRAPFNKSKN